MEALALLAGDVLTGSLLDRRFCFGANFGCLDCLLLVFGIVCFLSNSMRPYWSILPPLGLVSRPRDGGRALGLDRDESRRLFLGGGGGSLASNVAMVAEEASKTSLFRNPP